MIVKNRDCAGKQGYWGYSFNVFAEESCVVAGPRKGLACCLEIVVTGVQRLSGERATGKHREGALKTDCGED